MEYTYYARDREAVIRNRAGSLQQQLVPEQYTATAPLRVYAEDSLIVPSRFHDVTMLECSVSVLMVSEATVSAEYAEWHTDFFTEQRAANNTEFQAFIGRALQQLINERRIITRIIPRQSGTYLPQPFSLTLVPVAHLTHPEKGEAYISFYNLEYCLPDGTPRSDHWRKIILDRGRDFLELDPSKFYNPQIDVLEHETLHDFWGKRYNEQRKNFDG